MKTDRNTLLIALLLAGACVHQAAGAAEATSSAAAASQGKAGPATVAGETGADAAVSTNVDAESRARIERILERGKQASERARAKAEKRLAEAREKVHRAVETSGEPRIATRLAAEFGVKTAELYAEQTQFNCGWGELMIAHTLEASGTDVTVEELFAMRAGGAGWGQIAAGMQLRLGDVVSAVNAETKVATGSVRADGRVAAVRPEPARGASASADVNARAAAGAGRAGATAGVGAGASVSAPGVRVGN